MLVVKRLDHILISIPEGMKQIARIFYEKILGLEEISGAHPKGAIWFKIGNIQLHLREEPGITFSDRHPAFEVESLEAAKLFLESREVVVSYSTDIEGRQRLFFRDPFGNRFELLEYEK